MRTLLAVLLLSVSVQAQINTPCWEDSPFVSVDGSRLTFMVNPYNFWPFFSGGQPVLVGQCHPGQTVVSTPWSSSDVYQATRRADGSWAAPQRVTLGCCAMETTPGTLYLQEGKPSNPGDIDVVARQWNGSSWPLLNLGSGLNSTSLDGNPHALPGGSVIYFESNRPGGYGGYDLYRARRSCVLWFCRWTVSNLGPGVNTAANEEQVWVSPDETWLVFNRNTAGFVQHVRSSAMQPWSAGMPLDLGGGPAAEVSFGVWNGVVEAYYMAIDFAGQDIVLSRSYFDGSRWVALGPVN